MMGGAGLVPMLLWTEWVSGGNVSTCVPPPHVGSVRTGQDGRKFPACLVWVDGGNGWVGDDSLMLFRPWVQPEKQNVDVFWSQGSSPPSLPPPHGRCMTGAFFGVFGAATKCAMCYVAWFIIFLQATKLICSPIV